MKVVKKVQPPTGIVRFAARLPIQLYRAGLGWLLGGRFLRLTHVGRRSGKPREVVIEVIGHDDGYLVCSGMGRGADWYRNLRATPRARIQVGRRVLDVRAEELSAEEGGEVMATYASRHPKAARQLMKVMGFEVDGTSEDFRAVGRELPFLRLRPQS